MVTRPALFFWGSGPLISTRKRTRALLVSSWSPCAEKRPWVYVRHWWGNDLTAYVRRKGNSCSAVVHMEAAHLQFFNLMSRKWQSSVHRKSTHVSESPTHEIEPSACAPKKLGRRKHCKPMMFFSFFFFIDGVPQRSSCAFGRSVIRAAGVIKEFA